MDGVPSEPGFNPPPVVTVAVVDVADPVRKRQPMVRGCLKCSTSSMTCSYCILECETNELIKKKYMYFSCLTEMKQTFQIQCSCSTTDIQTGPLRITFTCKLQNNTPRIGVYIS